MAAKQANENEKENIPLPAKQGNADSQQDTSFVTTSASEWVQWLHAFPSLAIVNFILFVQSEKESYSCQTSSIPNTSSTCKKIKNWNQTVQNSIEIVIQNV